MFDTEKIALWREQNKSRLEAYMAMHCDAAVAEKELRQRQRQTQSYLDSLRPRQMAAAWYRHKAAPKAGAWRRRDRQKKAVALQVISAKDARQRRKDFDNACAYCGCTSDLHMDHFLPLSFGNALTLGNAVPACRSCNLSKNASDPSDWYQRQSFYCPTRWAKILRELGKRGHHHGQMTLI